MTFTSSHPWLCDLEHISHHRTFITPEIPPRALGTCCLCDLTSFEAVRFADWKPKSPAEVDMVQTIYHQMRSILKMMSDHFRMRRTELLQGLVLLERVLTGQRSSIPFLLTRENTPMALVVCMMMTNKMNADHPFTHSSWCKVFGIDPEALRKSEVFFLSCVNFSCHVGKEEFLAALELERKLMADE
jgi:hypothetical protein